MAQNRLINLTFAAEWLVPPPSIFPAEAALQLRRHTVLVIDQAKRKGQKRRGFHACVGWTSMVPFA